MIAKIAPAEIRTGACRTAAYVLSLLFVAAPLAFAADAGRAGGRGAPPQIPLGTPGGPLYTPPASQDISGIWWITAYSPKIEPLGGGELPFTPAGREKYQANMAALKSGTLTDDARLKCVPDGVPRILGTPYPFQIIQTPGQVTFVYELNHVFRPFVLDRPLPSAHELEIAPAYSGHSAAAWDGDTLVVTSAGFNEKTFLDATGAPHSDQMRTVERVKRLSPKALEITVEVSDPEIFTKPWSARYVYERHPELRLEDYNCGDTHRDISGVPGVKPPR